MERTERWSLNTSISRLCLQNPVDARLESAHVNHRQDFQALKSNQVQSMDSSHVALVSLNLKESAFTDFKCERPALQSQASGIGVQGVLSLRPMVLEVLPYLW